MPFAVVSNAGTTNTGAVDPLDAVADLCERDGLWHHIDGAYGAFFCSVGRAPTGAERPVPRRFADARSAQGHVSPVWHRRAARERRRRPSRRPRGHGCLSPRGAASGRFLRSEPARPGAVARVSRPACVALGEALRRGRLSRGDCRKAAAGARRVAPRRRASAHRHRRAAGAVALCLSRDVAGCQPCGGRCSDASRCSRTRPGADA